MECLQTWTVSVTKNSNQDNRMCICQVMWSLLPAVACGDDYRARTHPAVSPEWHWKTQKSEKDKLNILNLTWFCWKTVPQMKCCNPSHTEAFFLFFYFIFGLLTSYMLHYHNHDNVFQILSLLVHAVFRGKFEDLIFSVLFRSGCYDSVWTPAPSSDHIIKEFLS